MLREVLLNGTVSRGRGPPDIRNPIERIHILEHDRRHLRGLPRPDVFQVSDRGLSESPLHGRMNDGALLLYNALNPVLQVIHRPHERHGKKRLDLTRDKCIERIQVSGSGRP